MTEPESKPDFPMATDDESDNEYRARLRAWADTIDLNAAENPRGAWETLCWIAGVSPDDD